jgi:hypothetical protein
VGVDFRDLEQEICRIPEVSAARIVVNDEGVPVEVHILAAPTKLAKQVVRDVQSVALAAFGVELDRRTISVVQLEGSTLRLAPAPEGEGEAEVADSLAEGQEGEEPVSGDAPAAGPTTGTGPATGAGPPTGAGPATGVGQVAPPPPPARTARARSTPTATPTAPTAGPEPAGDSRTRLVSVQTERTGRRARAVVTLAVENRGQATGSAEGLFSEGAALRLVCLATLIALRQLDPLAERTDLESAAVVTVGMRHVAVVGIVVVDGPAEELCTGSAVVRVTGPFDALARATLDAVNRRLGRPS